MQGPMHRSVSQPSLGTLVSVAEANQAAAGNKKHVIEFKYGKYLWEGPLEKYTRAFVMLAWNVWFQGLVLVTVTYKYVVHFLIAYYLDESCIFLNITVFVCESIFFIDVFVHVLHACWPHVKKNIRVYRRHPFLLTYDIFSLFPVVLIFKNLVGYERYVLIGRWIDIGRIYRLSIFFRDINGYIRKSRKCIHVIQQVVGAILILHASTCIWYERHQTHDEEKPWHHQLGYPRQINSRMITFNSYKNSFYYCTCRYFNVIFGDSFPMSYHKKWHTLLLMLIGFIYFRYRFIGALARELVIENTRKQNIVDKYHHMRKYLTCSRAPTWLIDQCSNYTLQLWQMKDGILRSDELQNLPPSLQMELIFDINVSIFHNSLLFRDTQESFMRQISLLMHHELFLAGQPIWSQGVVKNGMIFIKSGVIEMLSDEDDESPMIAFKKGTVLGELSLFYSIPAKVTMKAATYVEIQILRRTDFMRSIHEHPAMHELIRQKILGRLQKSKSKQEAIERYDKGDSRLIRTRYRPMKVLKNNLAGIEEEDPTFVDDSHMYYRDEDNERQPKFTTEYLELYELSAKVTTIEMPRICLRSNFPWILMPDTEFTRAFDIAHFMMVLYVCFMSPYSAITIQQTSVAKVSMSIVIAGLLLNIYTQLTTAIVVKNVRKETVREIAEVKMATYGFYLDVISVFPMYIFTDTLDPGDATVIGQIAKLFPILQVWHIWDYLNKWASYFHSPVKVFCLIKYTIIFIILSYWSGCVLYLKACPRKLCVEQSWMSLLIFWETKIFITNDAKHENPLKTSFGFGTAVFTGTGTTDIAPGETDVYLVIFLFVSGAYISCLYSASVCTNYLLSTQRKLKFRESMRELFYFLSVNHVSRKIKARVEKFFSVQWYYNNAVSAEELFSDMSTNLQQEVRSMEMVDTLLYCPLFQVSNRDFLQTVAGNTRKILLPDNEVVQHSADIGRDMYIVKDGHCNLINQFGKKLMTIGPGDHFGVLEMLLGLPKVYTVVTSTNCILLHVEFSALVQCWGTFPDISHPIITVLDNADLKAKAAVFKESRPLTGRLDVKINRIAQEIKESFFVIMSREEKIDYKKAFDKLGVLRHIRYLFLPLCITPHGLFLKFWCTVRFLLAIFYIIAVPYDIATRQHKFGGSFNWIDLLSYIDIIVMAYVAYYNEKSLLVAHPLLTMTRYLRNAFIWDIISVFPFEQFVRIVNDRTDLNIFRINRILCVTRITSTFTYWEEDIMRVNPFVVLMKYLPIAITVINLATAYTFAHTCEPFLDPNYSTHIVVNCTSVLKLNSNPSEMTYAYKEYIYTFYWSYEVFMGLGCSPITMWNKVDMWLVMCLQITGFLYFAFMLGYVASTRSASANSLLDHNEKTTDLANFLYQENVDPSLTAKTLKYFEYVWKRTNGSNPQSICRRLNAALMEDTLVFMYERALREVPLFGKVERSFIRVITQHLHEMYFLKGDTVIQCKDIQSYIFIIYRGKVDVLSSYNEMITCMGPGGMFGNFTGQPISCSEVTIFASRSLDLLVIPSVTFFNLVKYYPKVKDPLTKAFDTSRDYILPITMEINDDTSSGEESSDDLISVESGSTMKSDGSKSSVSGQISLTMSLSSFSQSRSTTSVRTYQSYSDASNLLRPGSHLFQNFGYITCFMVTFHYVIGVYDIVALNDCPLLFWLHAICDIFFYIKIYLTMHQGYMSKHGLVIDGYKCRRRYFKHQLWLWSDVLANFPFEFIGFFLPNNIRAMHYLRVNKLLRLKYLYEFYKITSKELTNNITSLHAVMTVIAVVLMMHTLASIWLLVMICYFPMSYIRTVKLYLTDIASPHQQWNYVTSLYVIVSQLTATGFDEFVIEEILPMAILGTTLLGGKMLAALVVATAIQLAYATKYALTAYEKVTMELLDMLKNQGLSNYQVKKFWSYVKQLWTTERGRQLPVLVSQTPYVRRCDLMTAMFGHHLRNCFLFADTGEAFLRQLTAVLNYTIFFPGNYIVLAGDSEAKMYWVASGAVSVVSIRTDFTEITHETLGPGDVFGILQGMHRGISHSFSYRADTKATILTLSLDDWINILPFFPDAQNMINDRCEILFTQLI